MRLTIENVSITLGKKQIIRDVSTELTEGVYGFLGPNGSGKTTLMRMLASVLKPTTGRILFDGSDIQVLDARYRDILGYLPQHVGVYKNFTAERFLLYIAALKGLHPELAKTRVDELLKLVNLTEHRKSKIGKFSGGMKRRVGIAQALLNDPRVLIVDEPTAGLDPKERIRFRNLLSEISANRIVLLSTHIVSDIEFIAKEVLLLRQGSLIGKENPRTLLRTLEGKVWKVTAPKSEVQRIQASHRVGTLVQREDGVEVRILSDAQPDVQAVQVEPSLEDLYLYYFDSEVTA